MITFLSIVTYILCLLMIVFIAVFGAVLYVIIDIITLPLFIVHRLFNGNVRRYSDQVIEQLSKLSDKLDKFIEDISDDSSDDLDDYLYM